MKTLGLIPARGGSKGIPRKNIKSIGGKPLIAWTIEAARASKRLSAVVVSTDDAEIADVSRRYGADVPFLRPATLATDEAPGIAPVIHAIESLAGYDAVLLLQPTSPLRTSDDIDECLRLAAGRNGAPVVSVTPADAHPSWMFHMDADGRLQPVLGAAASESRRQDLSAVFVLNGAMYFAGCDWLRAHQTFIDPGTIGFPMPPERSIDVDTPLDWSIAELLLRKPS